MSLSRPPAGTVVWWLVMAVVGGYFLLRDDDPADEGRTSCTYAGAPRNVLTVRVEGDGLGEIVRRGNEIRVRRTDGPTSRCTGGTPTVRNTDAIKIVLVDLSFVEIDLSGGPFAPGATPESEGASEIEIEINSDLGGAEVYGTEDADVWHWGPAGDTPGLNLNPRDAGDTDVDVTTTGEDGISDGLGAVGGGGNDTIIGARGARVRGVFAADGGAGDDVLGTPGFVRSEVETGFGELLGGPGDDVLTGAATGDYLEGGGGADQLDGREGDDDVKGGPGRDRLVGGAGEDTITSRDSVSDIVSCGPGRDRVNRDARDEVSGCERVRGG
ncbi:MAG TPA: calcium-binding protein [Solirubrobacteraceae bacterium]|nr:calcium-binding protein [Solirubrobacteraceae bacterium]